MTPKLFLWENIDRSIAPFERRRNEMAQFTEPEKQRNITADTIEVQNIIREWFKIYTPLSW